MEKPDFKSDNKGYGVLVPAGNQQVFIERPGSSYFLTMFTPDEARNFAGDLLQAAVMAESNG